MNNIKIQKEEIRKKIKNLKSTLSNTERLKKSTVALLKLENEKSFREAKTILLYWSMNDEVYTHEFIEKWALQKRIILPSVSGNDLVLKVFKTVGDLIKGQKFGIQEPTGDNFSDYAKLTW